MYCFYVCASLKDQLDCIETFSYLPIVFFILFSPLLRLPLPPRDNEGECSFVRVSSRNEVLSPSGQIHRPHCRHLFKLLTSFVASSSCYTGTICMTGSR